MDRVFHNHSLWDFFHHLLSTCYWPVSETEYWAKQASGVFQYISSYVPMCLVNKSSSMENFCQSLLGGRAGRTSPWRERGPIWRMFNTALSVPSKFQHSCLGTALPISPAFQFIVFLIILCLFSLTLLIPGAGTLFARHWETSFPFKENKVWDELG